MGSRDPGVLSGRRTHLTPREMEVLSLLAAGYTCQEAATVCFISPKTVETHVANAKTVLGAKTTNHLIAMFVLKFQSPSPPETDA